MSAPVQDEPRVLLRTRDIVKSFGVVRALRDVSFDLRAGEVHGLMGENGAGKSTLIKVLTGLVRPDAGEILLDGRPVSFTGPRDSQRAGIAAVYQEINLIPERSVADNIFLGREPRQLGLFTDRRAMNQSAAEVLRRYGLAADPRQTLRTLGLGMQQMVSIARVVSLGARVVILDEPTSALTAAEVQQLMDVVERLRDEGIGVIYVSHRLSECYRLCDRLTVLRDGRVTESATPADLPRAKLIAAMLGRELGVERAGHGASERPDAEPGPASARAESREQAVPALSIDGLRWRTRVRDVSFDVARGEIVGLAGLLGSGRTETMKATYGAVVPEAGRVAVVGRVVPHPAPASSLRHRLAFLTEDRRSEGIFPRLSVAENLTAAVLPAISRFGIVSRAKQAALVERFTRQLAIKTSGPDAVITELSGGNQQKVLIARALCADPTAVMLDDPTRGIDVGAKAEVHRTVRALAADGLGVVVTSSEVEEVVELAHRLVVLDEGAVAGTIETAGRDPDDVLALLSAGAAEAGADAGAAATAGQAAR